MIETENVINKFVKESQEILKDNLTGIYLHGSAVMGCFNLEKSDLDLILMNMTLLSNMRDICYKRYRVNA